jgi:quercetin dioxygenase-like cupin family protein
VADDIHETVATNLAHAIPNLPGKSLVAVEVNYPPGGSSPPHRHAKSAFIYAYVVSGTIASQVEGEPAHTYRAGESFFETPGAHHVLGRNVSATEPAKLLAVFVVDAADKELTTPDR